MSEVENPANPAYSRPRQDAQLPYQCGYCDKPVPCRVERDWGGFCNVCGVSLPDDQGGSAVTEELERVAKAALALEPAKRNALLVLLPLYMGMFAAVTALLVMLPGVNLFVPGQPVTLANLVWVAVGGGLFTALAFFHAGIEPPQ